MNLLESFQRPPCPFLVLENVVGLPQMNVHDILDYEVEPLELQHLDPISGAAESQVDVPCWRCWFCFFVLLSYVGLQDFLVSCF